jgi:iron complex transport system ATP-binding protein
VASPSHPSPPLLELRRISVQRGETMALRDVSLTIGQGEHVAILGPNGCGKSTLVRTITRDCYPLPNPGSSISILGESLWNVAELRTLLGIVSNDLMARCTRDITGFELVLSAFFSSIGIWPHHRVTNSMRQRAREILAGLDIPHLAEKPVDQMSSGEAHRVLIGRALVHNPKTLLLDEPSSSLDLFAQHELRQTLRNLAQSGIGIVLVTHHLPDIIPEIERVVLMRNGQIAGDGPKDRLLTTSALEELFGVKIDLARRDGYYHAW